MTKMSKDYVGSKSTKPSGHTACKSMKKPSDNTRGSNKVREVKKMPSNY